MLHGAAVALLSSGHMQQASMQPNSFIGSLTLLFSRALVYSTFILLVCSFISHLSPPRVRCVHNYALQVVLVLQPHAALGFEAHVHGSHHLCLHTLAACPLPAGSSATYVLL